MTTILKWDYDLSDVMFVATSQLHEHSGAITRSYMEVIRLSGYTEDEKLNIAKQHLLQNRLNVMH